MTVMIEVRIVQLLCSRLCHDLAGVIGAVNNGIELINEMGGGTPDPEAMDLISGSAKEAARRLQYYRVAYGLAPGVVRSAGEAIELAKNYFSEGKVSIDASGSQLDMQKAFDEAEIKLLLNMLLLGSDALPRGGTLAIRLAENNGRLETMIAAKGMGARIGEEIKATDDPDLTADAVTARTVHGYFSALLAQSLGMKISARETGDDTVTIVAGVSGSG